MPLSMSPWLMSYIGRSLVFEKRPAQDQRAEGFLGIRIGDLGDEHFE